MYEVPVFVVISNHRLISI